MLFHKFRASTKVSTRLLYRGKASVDTASEPMVARPPFKLWYNQRQWLQRPCHRPRPRSRALRQSISKNIIACCEGCPAHAHSLSEYCILLSIRRWDSTLTAFYTNVTVTIVLRCGILQLCMCITYIPLES